MTSIAELLTILCPLILAADLLLFLGGEVIGDVESLSDLLGGLALDHVGNGLASNIKEGLDIKVVGCLRGNVNFCFQTNMGEVGLPE